MFVLCWFGCCCFVYLCFSCLCVALLPDFGLNLVFAFADCVGIWLLRVWLLFCGGIGLGDCGLVERVCLCCVIVLHWCWWVVLACGDLCGCLLDFVLGLRVVVAVVVWFAV